MTEQNKPKNEPREFWVTFKPYTVDPLGPCTNILKYVATFEHEHGLHVIEYRAFQAIEQKLRDAEAEIERLKKRLAPYQHNHVTRDIKPRGVCPSCDSYHDRQELEKLRAENLELRKALESADLVITQGLYVGSMTAPDFEAWLNNCQTCWDEIREALKMRGDK